MNAPNRIIARFDFGAVERVMRLLDWKWSSVPSGPRVPTIPELRMCALGLVDHCASNPKHVYISTGGFVARRLKDESGEEYLSLSFEVADTTESL